ncbi:MAG TPA: indolepyruvate ferredoxin oxidoreductase subunit alpha [Acidilobales archaeon]|nr:indolepyruvate ferredoxin oxidoreductase subunit alpha [Acidilobales archaeon]
MPKHVIGIDEPGRRAILIGNEAVARGALEAGVQVVTGYPGTPSSEVIETLSLVAKDYGFHVEWSINEKVAFDVAVGAAIVGARALTTMKNAGTNWIMDMFATIVYGGIAGGLVIFSADDPEAFYSSTEQDTRPLAKAVGVLILEPKDQQEAKDMARDAFDYSEKFELPVFLRSVTRISHCSGDVVFGEIRKSRNKVFFHRHYKMPFRWNVYGPFKYKGKTGPAAKHAWQLEQLEKIKEFVNSIKYNWIEEGDTSLGIITSGIGYSYVKDALIELKVSKKPWILKIGTPYPLPEELLKKFIDNVDRILVVEEGDPFVEEQLYAFMKEYSPEKPIYGKLKRQLLLRYGELGITQVVNAVAKFLNVEIPQIPAERRKLKNEIAKVVAPRSSALCPGCPHLGTYWALRFALIRSISKFKGVRGVWIVNGDIGCYEQGGYGIFAREIKPSESKESIRVMFDNPYEILDTNYIMGGGIGTAQGEYHAGFRDGPIVAVAGDSTFFHACMTALANAAYNKAAITFIVLDNAWTAMTGHQPSPTTGLTATLEPARVFKIEEVAKALGIDHIWVVDPFNVKETQKAIEEAIEVTMTKNVPTLVVARRECTLQVMRRLTREGKQVTPYVVIEDKCIGCRLCVQLGCPAVGWDKRKRKAFIDPVLCAACSLCAQVCPVNAIVPGKGKSLRDYVG